MGWTLGAHWAPQNFPLALVLGPIFRLEKQSCQITIPPNKYGLEKVFGAIILKFGFGSHDWKWP